MKLNVLVLVGFLFSTISAFAGFSNETSLGLVSSRGNTEVNTYNLKTTSGYAWSVWDISLGGHYTLSDQKNTETDAVEESARNWDANVKFARNIKGNLSVFIAHKIEGDRFSGFIERNNSDFGLSYSFLSTDSEKLYMDLGYRRQITTPVVGKHFDTNKGRIYVEHSKKYNPNFSSKFWVEYLPDFDDPKKNGNQVNFEPSIASTLSDMFSLQVAYKGMYNSAPVGGAKKHFDSVFTTSLLSKF